MDSTPNLDRARPTYFCMISSIGTSKSSGGRGCRATAMVTFLFDRSWAESYSAYRAIDISAALSGMLRGAFMYRFDEATRRNQ